MVLDEFFEGLDHPLGPFQSIGAKTSFDDFVLAYVVDGLFELSYEVRPGDFAGLDYTEASPPPGSAWQQPAVPALRRLLSLWICLAYST